MEYLETHNGINSFEIQTVRIVRIKQFNEMNRTFDLRETDNLLPNLLNSVRSTVQLEIGSVEISESH